MPVTTRPPPIGDGGPLIDAHTLRESLAGALRAAADAADSTTTVLDVRWRLGGPSGRISYAAGHIPGAVFVDLDDELAGAPGENGRHPLPSPVVLQLALQRAGVRTGSPVVVYDGGDGNGAARAWWVLRWAGLERVQVLDGGYPAWRAAGGQVSLVMPDPARGDVVVVPGSMPVLDAEAAARMAGDGVLLDARTPERYRGEKEPIDPVAGHVPGAVSAPAGADLTDDGRLRTAEELHRHYHELGVGPDAPVGAYCGSGVTACRTVLALELAGIPAALYAGSWSEWITDPDRPVATGADPWGSLEGAEERRNT